MIEPRKSSLTLVSTSSPPKEAATLELLSGVILLWQSISRKRSHGRHRIPEMKTLAKFAEGQPHTSYAVFIHGPSSHWTYQCRTMPGVAPLLQPVKDVFWTELTTHAWLWCSRWPRACHARPPRWPRWPWPDEHGAPDRLLRPLSKADCSTGRANFKSNHFSSVISLLNNNWSSSRSTSLREMAIDFTTWVSVLLGTRTTSCHVVGRAWSTTADDRARLAGIGIERRSKERRAVWENSCSQVQVDFDAQCTCSWAWVRVDLGRSTKRRRERVLWPTQLELGLHIVSPASKACVWLAACR